MKPRDRNLAEELDAVLRSFDKETRRLPGIQAPANRAAFLEQLLESIHRVKYISVIRTRKLSELRTDSASDLFDPLKAAVLHHGQGHVDEAIWLVFVSVHFGKNRRTGWRLARDVYGRLGGSDRWDWARTSSDPKGFRQWLGTTQATLQGKDGIARHFGNHRKYQSLDAKSPTGTGAAVESYVNWVRPPRTHQTLMQEAQEQAGDDPRQAFDYLYRAMKIVTSFGRTAKFDYLTMVGKLGLAQIEPGSTYMHGATGPFNGARLLFGENMAAAALDKCLVQLEGYLHVDFGMQVLEDALCNWQKSPGRFIPFRG